MKNKNKIITVVIILILLAAGATLFTFKDKLFPTETTRSEAARVQNPRLVTLDFYNQWLEETKSTTTSPFTSGLINSPVLSSEVRSQIEREQAARKGKDVDPLLCMPKVPNRLLSKEIFTESNKALVVITPRDKDITTEHQAVVGLTLVDDKWLITKIDCTEGERAPVKEFDFEKIGFLLKESIQAPYNKENWHLVYEQETQPGFVAPLSFTIESVCIAADKTESTCDPAKLTEATKVFIQAGMTESGAVVKRMTFQQ
jgi:hypothetical protein